MYIAKHFRAHVLKYATQMKTTFDIYFTIHDLGKEKGEFAIPSSKLLEIDNCRLMPKEIHRRHSLKGQIVSFCAYVP